MIRRLIVDTVKRLFDRQEGDKAEMISWFSR